MVRPCFSPVINLGHILQAMVIILTVGGGIVTAYVSLRTDLARQRAQMEIAMAGFEVRLTDAERQIAERRDEDHVFKNEVRHSLAQIMSRLADLKTQLVQKADRK